MKRSVLFCLLGTIAVAPAAGSAQSPHFIRASPSLEADGDLQVCFKEAGLGTNQNIDYLLDATSTAIYVCETNGGNCPAAANKIGPSDVTAPGTFNSGKNGSVTACLTLHPPSNTVTCPSGQAAVLGFVTYSGITLTDTTNTVTEPVPGTFTFNATFPAGSNCPDRIAAAQ